MSIFARRMTKRPVVSTFVLWLAMTPLILSAASPSVSVKISPVPVIVGEPSELRVVSSLDFPELDAKPKIDGVKWSDTPPMRAKRSNLGTRRTSSFETVYEFTPTKEGEITIPQLTIYVGQAKVKSRPLRVKAFKRKLVDSNGNIIPIEKLLFMTATLDTGGKNRIYVGEEAQLEIRLYSIKGLPASPTAWPIVNIDNIVTRDYSDVNPESPHFLPPSRDIVNAKNKVFNVETFKCGIRPISPGKLRGNVSIPCVIRLPVDTTSRQRTGDPFEDFFSGGLFTSRYKNIPYSLSAEIKPKTVIPLPKTPENAAFLGLVGEWTVKCSLGTDKLKVGEAVTLTVVVKGRGTVDSLTTPKLRLDDFRAYPPEVKKVSSTDGVDQANIKYALIPLRAGPVALNLAFSTFSPDKNAYVLKRFAKKLVVAKGDATAMGTSLVDSAAARQTGTPPSRDMAPDILYLKGRGMGEVAIPLSKNKLSWIILFVLIGPLCLVVAEITTYRREKLSGDVSLRRRKNALKRKNAVIAKIKRVDDGALAEVVRNDVTPLVNDILGFPPGTTAEELARKVDDKGLAECLEFSGSSSYMPGAGHDINPATIKQQLLKTLKRLSIALLALCPFFFSASAGENPMTAYDNGKPEVTAKFYAEKLNPQHPDPAWLYNLGNCAVKQGDFPRALVYYERARRLAPGDSDIRENLNYVRRKLFLPEVDSAKTPLDTLRNLRDSIRPDSWALAAAILWSLSWGVLALRRRLSIRQWISILTILAFLMCVSLVALISQEATTYNPDNAIVVKPNTKVRSLPSPLYKPEFKLHAGEKVRVEEERHDWLRIRTGNAEGWIKPDAIEKLWPY